MRGRTDETDVGGSEGGRNELHIVDFVQVRAVNELGLKSLKN